jgi:Fe2+ transport system protein FeoA
MKNDFNTAASAESVTPLSDVAPGARAVVVDVVLDGPIGRRLLDLGLLPGTPVTVVRRAPLGDPSVYELRGYRLCLRRADASRVRVKREAAASPRADA